MRPSELPDASASEHRRVIVLAGGEWARPRLVRPLATDAEVIAADGGLELAGALDLDVGLVVGDLDSVDPTQLAEAAASGARIERHPVDKDRTDLAIALDAVAADGPAQVTVIRHAAELIGEAGELISLVPVHGAATGVTTRGLGFPLTDGELSSGSSRGVSNVFADEVAHVRLSTGVLLAIQPGERAPTDDAPDDGVAAR